ncbi:MAG TPA: GGDEF domain-containing protein [Actinomycetota bacterium]|nr:GGDEF domain-containing protein [Actinomycetota bacterium]
MHAPVVPLPEAPPARRMLSSLVTEQVRVMLEERTTRLGVVGVLLVVASLFSLVPTMEGIDPGWMFIIPVAISATAAGLKEGLFTALAASTLVALYTGASTGNFDPGVVAGVVAARFVLYGLTAAFLGAFAEAHYAVQSGLRQLASTDPLTRLSNVARFYEEMGTLERDFNNFAFLVVDMDDLKTLNDRYGHQAGSLAIQTIANCLRRVVRGSDCVARFGGDEFVIVLKDADRAGAQIVINRLREMLAAEILPCAPEVTLEVSVGVAIAGEDGSTSEELLAAADIAMYTDKRARKSGSVVIPEEVTV